MRSDSIFPAPDNDVGAPTQRGADSRRVQGLPHIAEAPTGYAPFPEVPRVSFGDALRRHWVAALIPLIVCVGAALFYGLNRTPNYTAEARLSVGGIDLSQPGALSGFEQATTGLASSYSRAITSDQVVVPVSRRLGVDKYTIAGQLAATPLPDSPVIRVQAVATSPDEAVTVANAAGRSLITYTRKLNRPMPTAPEVLREYRRAAAVYHARQAETRNVRAAYEFSESPADSARLDSAVAAERVAKLRVDSLQLRYQTLSEGRVGTKVAFANPAAGAWSDRGSRLQFVLFMGGAAGIALGCALALLLSNRQLRRTLPA
jgi:uncharacterized protein involved in exopolysaccharide biosynthesis